MIIQYLLSFHCYDEYVWGKKIDRYGLCNARIFAVLFDLYKKDVFYCTK